MVLNVAIVPYPVDNDLDEVGWLVQNLSFGRLTSLANANYPAGLPVLLKMLTAITGDLLRTALALEALACSAIVLLACRLVTILVGDMRAATLGALLTAGLVFRSATSEFADGIAAALLLGGITCLLTADGRRRSLILSGALMGMAYLFRYHYLTGLLLVPAAALVLPGTRTLRVERSLTLIAGFLIGCSPLLIINLLAHGNPFYTGISAYIMGQHVMQSVDWNDYLSTYDAWPAGRLLSEHPFTVLKHWAAAAAGLAYRTTALAAILLVPVSAGFLKRPEARRILLFLVICVLGYVALVTLPTLATDRALLPVDVLLGILVLPGLYYGTRSLDRQLRWIRVAALVVAVLLLIGLPTSVHHVQKKRQALAYNGILCDKLKEAGVVSSAEVFCNHWNVFPLDDADFVTYYNYGGWLLLDPAYAAERPRPVARTVEEWQAFMREQGLRFLVIRKTEETVAFFDGKLSAADWEVVHFDGTFGILRLRKETG